MGKGSIWTDIGELAGMGFIYIAFALIGQLVSRKWAKDYEERHGVD